MPRIKGGHYTPGGLPASLGGAAAYSYSSGGTPPATTYTPNNPRKVLFLYGDVKDTGQIPSGGSPYDQQRITDTATKGFSQVAAALEALTPGGGVSGITVSEQYDVDFDVNDVYLFDAIFLHSSQRNFTPTEVAKFHDACKQGVGLVHCSDSALGGSPGGAPGGTSNTVGQDARNLLFETFDGNELWQTSVDQANGTKTVQVSASEAVSGGSQKDFEGEGVSPIVISTSAPAGYNVRSATVQDFDVQHAYPKADNITYTGAVTLLALAEPDSGRIAGVGDRQFFWNGPGAPGSDITEVDNQTVVENIFLWVMQLI